MQYFVKVLALNCIFIIIARTAFPILSDITSTHSDRFKVDELEIFIPVL